MCNIQKPICLGKTYPKRFVKSRGKYFNSVKKKSRILVFFSKGSDLFQLDELDELDRITHACIGFNYSVTQTQETF